MIFEQIPVGGDRNLAYLIGDEESKEAAVIDPAYAPELLIRLAEGFGLTIKYIINTHDHYDHSGGNHIVQKATGAKVAAHASDNPEVPLNDGDVLTLGELELKVIHTPGHTQDSICILAENKLCTGDTLFVGKVGGTDYGEGAHMEYESLHNKLMTLPDNTEVYPGHDVGGKPVSTIKEERETNPFIQQKSFHDFIHLKRHWPQYKREHGIP
jgi:glyoxylase-like metal-dependent hydrolase (beta-lactamase superfamily II)